MPLENDIKKMEQNFLVKDDNEAKMWPSLKYFANHGQIPEQFKLIYR